MCNNGMGLSLLSLTSRIDLGKQNYLHLNTEIAQVKKHLILYSQVEDKNHLILYNQYHVDILTIQIYSNLNTRRVQPYFRVDVKYGISILR